MDTNLRYYGKPVSVQTRLKSLQEKDNGRYFELMMQSPVTKQNVMNWFQTHPVFRHKIYINKDDMLEESDTYVEISEIQFQQNNKFVPIFAPEHYIDLHDIDLIKDMRNDKDCTQYVELRITNSNLIIDRQPGEWIYICNALTDIFPVTFDKKKLPNVIFLPEWIFDETVRDLICIEIHLNVPNDQPRILVNVPIHRAVYV